MDANIKLFVDDEIVIERIKPTSDYAIDLCNLGSAKEFITTWDYFHTHSADSIEIKI